MRAALRRPRSWTLQEPEVEAREYQDNSNVHYQALPEEVPEEQDVHADHDGVQVLRAGSLPVVDDLTYPGHGATAGSLPEGCHHLERQARLGSGREVRRLAAGSR